MSVKTSQLVLGSLLICITACAGLPLFKTLSQDSDARAILELQNARYDGETLAGRMLIGVAEGTLTIDRRLIENASLEVVSVKDCATGQATGFIETDSFPPPVSEDELLTLTPGYWYGGEVRFLLFAPEFTGAHAPDCVEVAIVYRNDAGHVMGNLNVRAEREASSALDAGMPLPASRDAGPATDAGVRWPEE